MKNKIILIYPDLFRKNYTALPPLSLIYIATPLRGLYDVAIIDQRTDKHWKTTLSHELQTGNILCAGISTMTGPQIFGGIETAKLIRQVSPATPIVWGGVHPSLLPDETINSEYVDMVVIGDGEETFRELLHALEHNFDKHQVKGLIYKENGQIIKTEPRGQFPLKNLSAIHYDLIPFDYYKATPLWTENKSLPIITSRGCPYRCGYCYNTQFCKRHWTALPAEQVIANIEQLIDQYQINGIFLLDDNFFVDLERVRSICQLLIEKDLKISIYNANCRVDTLMKMDDQLLQLLKKAGFNQIFIGVESGSADILQKIKKDITIEQIKAINHKMKKADLTPFYSFMAAFPFESTEQVKETLILMNLLLKENPQAFIYKLQLFTPFPGTALFDEAGQMGMQYPKTLEAWAEYHYDKLNYTGFSKSHQKFLADFQLYSIYLDTKISPHRNPFYKWVSNLYSKLLKFRIHHNFFHFLIELIPLKLAYNFKNRQE
jgi:radical SAM superfamily enzyme YgiQ (UPF0313 family)